MGGLLHVAMDDMFEIIIRTPSEEISEQYMLEFMKELPQCHPSF